MNKRIQSAITQSFIFHLFVTIGFISLLMFYINPMLFEIGEKQAELNTTRENLSTIKKEGLTLKEFKSFYKEYTDSEDPYVGNILKTLDDEFYKQNLSNTTDSVYNEFLDEKKQELIDKKNSKEFLDTEKQIQTILPPYSTKAGSDDVLSDHDFTNYVESLLFTFNLQTNDSIGVGALVPYGKQSTNKEEAIPIDSSIFYIPLQLELTGQKKDILDFLHYMENAGAISIKDGNLETYSDSVIKKVLEGDTGGFDYNIYEHQIAEIESITMKDYIDSSSELSTGILSTFIKKTQGREKFTIEVSLRFYVSGLPEYKVEKFITETVTKYETVKKRILTAIEENKKNKSDVESSDVLFAINSINGLRYTVESIGETTLELRKTLLKDKSKIGVVYEKSLQIDQQLDRIIDILVKNQRVIDTIKK